MSMNVNKWMYCYSLEIQATVTPPSSLSENLIRKVPTSLACRNSSACWRDTKPNSALQWVIKKGSTLQDMGDKSVRWAAPHPSIHIPRRSSLVSFITA